MSARTGVAVLGVSLVLMTVMASPAVAQRGGRGGRGGSAMPAGVEIRSRLEIMTDAFTLDKDQKKQVKDTMDAAYKEAAPIRASLKKARMDLGAAVIAGRPDADLEAAQKAYAMEAARMAEAEMKALATILTPLRAEQRAQGTMTTFYLMRGALLDDKKWDEIPEMKAY